MNLYPMGKPGRAELLTEMIFLAFGGGSVFGSGSSEVCRSFGFVY